MRKFRAKQCKEPGCGALHKRENAHSILFLTHHRSDPWVIEQMMATLRGAFQDSFPMEFDGDVSALNSLIDTASQLVIAKPDVDHHQNEHRQFRDEIEAREDDEETKRKELREGLEFVDRLYLVIRTAENLGQILKNYYGSLERPVKIELMKEIFDGLLRTYP